MNVLYAMTAFPPSTGGAQTHLFEIAKRIGKNHQVQAVCHWSQNRHDWLRGVTIHAPDDKRYIEEDLPIYQMNLDDEQRRKLAFWSYSYYLTINTSVEKIAYAMMEKMDKAVGQVDIIHAGRIGREFLCWAAYKLARKRGIPFVLTPFHHPRWKGYLYRKYLALYRLADAVMALTRAEKKILTELGVESDKIHVVGHAPCVPNSKPSSEYFGPGGPVILFLGQKYPYKGVGQLLKAMPLVWKTNPEARFAFIGPRTNYSGKLFEKINDKRVIETARISELEKIAALNDCTIFCLPSRQESFGGVYAEAWMYKKPVIGGNIAAIADVIDHGQNGLLVGSAPHELGAAILNLLQSPKLRTEMGEKGFHKVQKHYNWEVIADKHERIYRDLT